MDKMIAANSQRIPISHHHYHLKPGLGQLETGSKGQGATMRGVHRVEIKIDRHTSSAAYPGNDSNIVLCQANSIDCADQCAHYHTDAAAAAPDVRKFFGLSKVTIS